MHRIYRLFLIGLLVFAGCSSGEEALPPDTDGDGVVDSLDICPGEPDPLQLDADADGVGDLCDIDDGDHDGD